MVRTNTQPLYAVLIVCFHPGEKITLQELSVSTENRQAFDDATEEQVQEVIESFDSRHEGKRSHRRPTAQARISVINKVEISIMSEVRKFTTYSAMVHFTNKF